MIGELPAVVTANEKGEAKIAPERFKSSGELREVCQEMIAADRSHAALRTLVDGHANGNPTYKLSALKAKGQAWRARTNYRGMQGLLNLTANTFYDMNTEVNPCVRIFLDYGEGQQREDWQECIAAEYSRMILNQWQSFDYHIPLRDNSMLRHGLGAHVWTTNNKWEPETPTAGQILFPSNASVDFHNKGEAFLLRHFLPSHRLYANIRHERAAANLGWKPDIAWKVLANASKKAGNSDTPEKFRENMQTADYGTARQAGVWLNYYFIIELDSQKITQYIIDEDGIATDYMFKKRNRFDEFPLVLFPYEIPDSGLIRDIIGLGARTREHFELINRVYNAMADNVLISMYPQFSQTANVDPEKLKLMRVGAMSIYPHGVKPEQMQFPPLGNSGLALSRELERSVNSNNQNYLTGTPEPKDRETALSFSMRAQDSAQVSKGTHSLYYRNVTRFHTKIIRMAVKDAPGNEPWAVMARNFRERCIEKGVPKEAFNHIEEVEAKRSIGGGSASARLQTLMQLWQTIYPVTTEDRKIAIERDITTALVGYAETNRYARNTADNDLPDSDASLAVQENNGLANGGEALAASAQDHVGHLQQHLAKAQGIVAAIDAGEMDPAQGLAIIQQIGAHCGQHLQQLQGNPMRKAEFDALYKEWQALAAIADKLQAQVEEMQAAEEEPSPEEQISEDFRLGMAKIETNAALGQQKFQHKAGLDEVKFRTKTALQVRQQAVNERLAKSRNGNRPAKAGA